MSLNNADGSVYSRSGNVSQSENSSNSTSDPEEVLVEEQEPGSSTSSALRSEFSTGSSVLHLIRQNCPWANRRYSPDFESLHDEVVDLFTWLRPTAEEIGLRRSVFLRVSAEMQMIYPDAQVHLIGSVATNLFLPSSDIDISVRVRNYHSVNLHAIAEAFKLLDVFDNVEVVDRTDVPIVKLRHKDTKYSIDISFNRHFNVLKNVNYVNSMKNEYPELEPLTMVLKQYLAYNKLNKPFSGGLSSYGLILMVIAFLKTYSKEALRGIVDENAQLGALLYHFFHFYAHFNYNDYGIRVRGNHSSICVVDKELLAKPANEDKYSSIFFIEDPLQRGNNVSKSTYNMMGITAAFRNAWNYLRSALMTCRQESVRQFYWGPMCSLLIVITPEEANYRKMQRDEVIRNSDILLQTRMDNRRTSFSSSVMDTNFDGGMAPRDTALSDINSVPKQQQSRQNGMVMSSVPSPPSAAGDAHNIGYVAAGPLLPVGAVPATISGQLLPIVRTTIPGQLMPVFVTGPPLSLMTTSANNLER